MNTQSYALQYPLGLNLADAPFVGHHMTSAFSFSDLFDFSEMSSRGLAFLVMICMYLIAGASATMAQDSNGNIKVVPIAANRVVLEEEAKHDSKIKMLTVRRGAPMMSLDINSVQEKGRWQAAFFIKSVTNVSSMLQGGFREVKRFPRVGFFGLKRMLKKANPVNFAKIEKIFKKTDKVTGHQTLYVVYKPEVVDVDEMKRLDRFVSEIVGKKMLETKSVTVKDARSSAETEADEGPDLE